MSRNTVLYISASLDGYIARDNGAVDWLTGNSGDENVDLRFDKFYSSVDTVVMGRTSYKQMINELSPDTWVYEGKKSYVASRKIDGDDTRVEYIKGDITGFIKDLKNQKDKDI